MFLSSFLFLTFDRQSGVRHHAQAFLGDELAGGTADAVGFVVDAHQGCPQVIDKNPFSYISFSLGSE